MLEVEPLGSAHDRAGFDCGVIALNHYLRETARQHLAKGISKTFVLIDEAAGAPKPILGFFTLSLCQIQSDAVPPKWASRLPARIPAMKLGRLAVSLTSQGQGFGRVLLVEAIQRVAAVSGVAGGIGPFVDAKDEKVAQWYGRFGFEPTPTGALTLFLPMATLETLARP